MKKILDKLFVGVLTLFLISGCESFLEVEPYGNVTPETFFTNESEAILAVNSAYSAQRAAVGWWASGFDLYGEWQSDDLSPIGWSDGILLYQYGSTGDDQGVSSGIWSAAYRGIAQCNAAIEGVEGMTEEQIGTDIKNRVISEAKFLRGWWHLRLAQIYGNAPLVLKTPVTEEERFPSSVSKDQLIEAAINDFKDAGQYLPASYSNNDVGRITKGCALAHEAWANMYMENWSEALTALNACINLNVYELVDYLDICNENSKHNKESVFETGFNSNATGELNWRPYYCGVGASDQLHSNHSTWNIMAPSFSLIEEYEEGDPRLDYTFWVEGEVSPATGNAFIPLNDPSRPYQEIQKGTVYYPSSYTDPSVNITWMRYADVLLMTAECLNETGNAAEANQYVNMVRQRPGVDMTPINITDQAEMRAAIIHERRIEFAMEGRRAYDIRRWGIEEETLGQMDGTSYSERNKYFPVPVNELDVNPNLSNAPGW